ncbi:MAG: hypothetical protein M0Z28_32195 [Rhodospirillales bacterium]|nr:hypothetical protein [Rhodospirillales bacterium]
MPEIDNSAAALDRMMNTAPMDAARAELLAVHERRVALSADMAAARKALAEAEAARAVLVERASAGGAVTAAETVDAELAVRAAESHVLFLSDAIRALSDRESKGQAAIPAAQQTAALPVAKHGAKLRVAAAERLAAAQAELAAAERSYDDATAVIAHAFTRGWRAPGDTARDINPPPRPLRIDEQHRMIAVRHAPDRERAFLGAAGLL